MSGDGAKGNARKERRSQVKQWWHQPVDQWKELLSQLGAQQVATAGQTLKFCCPYHNDANPSATLNIGKGFFKCWSSSCLTHVQDPVKLIQKLEGCNYTDALITFKKHFKLRNISKDETEEYTKDERVRYRAKVVQQVLHDYACSVYVMQTGPTTALQTRKYLKEIRGITDISMFPGLGMLPRQATFKELLRKAGLDTEDLEAVLRWFKPYLTTPYMDNIVLVYAKSPNHITGFKFRYPGPDKEIKTLPLYDNEELGAFGILSPAYYPLYNHEKVDKCCLVEGDFDQLSILQGQIKSGSFDDIFLALGGSGNRGANFLTELGITKVDVIGDHDDGGEKYARQIMHQSSKMNVRVFTWPYALHNPTIGKIDPDESVKVHGFDKTIEAFLDDNHYSFAPKWCLAQAEHELKKVSEDDVVTQEKVASEWGKLLHHELERKVFAEGFAKRHVNVPSSSIMTAVVRANRGPLGFEQQIVDWILDKFHPVLNDMYNNELQLWHKEQELLLGLRRDTNACISTFKTFIPEGSFYDWIKQDVGLPPYFPDVEAEDATQAALDKVESSIEKVVHRSISRVASMAAVDNSNLLGQGLHFKHVENTLRAYMLNGKHFYRLNYTNEGEFKNMEALPGPSDGKVLFDLEHRMVLCPTSEGWNPELGSIKAFKRKPKYTLKQAFTRVHSIIDKLFSFKHQEVDSVIATAMVFYSYILTAIPDRRALIHIHGMYESGKTTLLSLICNHPQLSEYAFTRGAACLDNCTPAAVFQGFNNSSLVMGLDEMNDADDGSLESQSKQRIQQYVRGLATSGTTRRDTGTRSGQVRSMSLYNTMVSAASTLPANDMDASRMIILSLSKDDNKENAKVALAKLLPIEDAADLRHSIFVGAVSIAAKLNNKYKSLYSVYADYAKKNDLPTLNRDLENVLPLAAVIELAQGESVLPFIINYQESRGDAKKERQKSSEENSLLDVILNSDKIAVPGEDGTRHVSIRVMLVTDDLKEKINVYSNHIKFDPATRSIVVNWDDIYPLLAGTRHVRASKKALKLLADSTRCFIQDKNAKRMGILARAKASGLAGANLLSAYSVDEILSDYEAAVKWIQSDEEKKLQARKKD